MHIRYSFVKQNYSDVLRLSGKTISNGKIEIGTVKKLFRYSYGTQKRSPLPVKKLFIIYAVTYFLYSDGERNITERYLL